VNRMKKTTVVTISALLVLGLFIAVAPAGATGGEPTVVPGNPTCADLGYDFGFKPQPEPPPSGTYPFPNDPYNSVTIDTDGTALYTYFDWSSPTLGIDAVIVKGGDAANVYAYDPESFGDTGLHSPEKNGNIPDVSHIEFCYDYEVDVEKDAETSFTRTYEWDITKSVVPDTWHLFAGDSGTSRYTVAVEKTGFTDSDWAVSGNIYVANNTPFKATITSVSDEISGFGAAAVDCGVAFPYELPSGGTLTCSYSASLSDGSNRTNTATVETSGTVGGGEGTAGVVFGAPTTEVNKEINVTDSNAGSWGPVSGTTSWTYEKTFTEAGTYGNVATIVETGQSDNAEVTVNVYSMNVSKDADTSFNRYWTWSIDKRADQSELTLAAGQPFLVNYWVTVDASYGDNDFAVSGDISVHNPAPMAATINGVEDVLPGATNLSVNCGDVAFPYTLPAGQTLQCSYSADLPDASNRTNTAKAKLQNYTYDYQLNATPAGETEFAGTAEVAFGATPDDEIDECIDVSDTNVGFLGTVCAADAPKTFEYSLWVGPYDACGTYEVANTASFVTNDNGNTGSDNWTVHVTVPCAGCTLTQGYWKTHSSHGPAPYDDTWDLRDGGDALFLGTGKSYYEILWTVPKGGNAYIILAHQYIAAELNKLNGAYVPPEVQSAMDEAEELLIKYEEKLSIPKKGADREWAIELYELLDDYNNGYIGPGHCSE